MNQTIQFKNEIQILDYLSPLDWAIFFIIMGITVGFVIWGQFKKKKSISEEEDFVDLMLMGRQLTLPMFIATLVATWYGGIFGVAQIAFENGIFNFVTQGLFWYVTYIIFAFYIIKKIKNYSAMTLPDLVGQMFGPKAEKLSAVFNFINLIPIAYAISIGFLIQMLFGFPLLLSVAAGIIFVLGYSLFGGFRAVVFSDIVQFFVMCISVVAICLYSIGSFGTAPLMNLPDSYFHPMGTYSFLETFSWGLIALSTLVDPNFYQRSFAAEDFTIAKKGILYSTVIWIIFDLCLTTGAMYAKAMMPEANSNYAYFTYAMQLLPEGMRGFVLAGIAATVLSTLDSYIFLAGSTVAYDIVPKRMRGKVSIHHMGVLSVGIISIIMAGLFEGNIKAVWKTLGSLSTSAILIPVMAGHIFPKRFSDGQFVFASLCGALSTIIWRLSGLKAYYQLDEIYIGGLSALIAITLSYKLSLFPKSKISE